MSGAARRETQTSGKSLDSPSIRTVADPFTETTGRLRRKASVGADNGVGPTPAPASCSPHNTSDQIHFDNYGTYMYVPRNQLQGSSVMLLMTDTHDMPPSYQATL